MRKYLEPLVLGPLSLWLLLTLLTLPIQTPPAAAAQTPSTSVAAANQPASQAARANSSSAAQISSGAASMPGPDPQGFGMTTLDVVVQDKNGRPVHGLKSGDFRLTEDQAPQTIHSVAEHQPIQAAAKIPDLPRLPPGTFTDYAAVPTDGVLNIVLLDALNTPLKDQGLLRYELRQYADYASQGSSRRTPVAVLGLTNHLFLLQDFTSAPETLEDVVDRKLVPRTSAMWNDPAAKSSSQSASSTASPIVESGPSMAQIAANVTAFETQMLTNVEPHMQALSQSAQMQLRRQYTLDAFNTLAHYLATFPGRKNLIWFSCSFPIDLWPGGSQPNPPSIPQGSDQEFAETAALLAKAQVAVYPVDARGLVAHKFEATSAGQTVLPPPRKLSSGAAKYDSSQAQEHTTMDQIATNSGGQAFYDVSSLSQGVAQAVQAGSDFYTLTFASSRPKLDESYRTIGVALSGSDAPPGLQLSFLHGYFADVPLPPGPDAGAAGSPAAAEPGAGTATPDRYGIAAMSRGAPPPAEVLFKVRVLPASTSTEAKAKTAESNVLKPHAGYQGPSQSYAVDCVALANEFSLAPAAGEQRSGRVEFVAYLYDPDGRLLNSAGRSARFGVTPANYKEYLQSALELHLDVSAPVNREAYLRIGLHDVNADRWGVVEVPILDVSRLPPPADRAPSPESPPGANTGGSSSPSSAPPR